METEGERTSVVDGQTQLTLRTAGGRRLQYFINCVRHWATTVNTVSARYWLSLTTPFHPHEERAH